MTFDPDTLVDVLDVAGPGRVAVTSAIGARPEVRLETSGASTLELRCLDVDHEIPGQADGLTAAAAGRTWQLVAVKRLNGSTRLVFHDDVVRALGTDRGPMAIPAGSTTVNELATRLARACGVDVLLEPTRQTLAAAFTRDASTWAGLNVLAEQTGRWRYSDGTRLVLASPSWLLTQDVTDTIVEGGDQVEFIDYDLHSNKPLETAVATLTVDDDTVPGVGTVHELDVPGPAAGEWLVASWVTRLGEDHGRITWHRPRTTSWS